MLNVILDHLQKVQRSLFDSLGVIIYLSLSLAIKVSLLCFGVQLRFTSFCMASLAQIEAGTASG